MKTRQLRLLATLRARRYDLALAIGVAIAAVGIACIYWPAGLIVAGAAIGWWGVIGARTEAAERRAEKRRLEGIS